MVGNDSAMRNCTKFKVGKLIGMEYLHLDLTAELREAIASTVGDVSGVETCTMFITKTPGGKRYVARDPRVRN